jgi:GTP-binding protein Era
MTHKAGYVNIIGNPNVGKSTLMNALVGEKLSIITSKAQTTRHRILGIVNNDNFQIVFSDTPGIINKPAYKMHELMNQYIETALVDADVILFVVDVMEKADYTETIEKIISTSIPVFVLLNKIDLSNQAETEMLLDDWQ